MTDQEILRYATELQGHIDAARHSVMELRCAGLEHGAAEDLVVLEALLSYAYNHSNALVYHAQDGAE